MESTRGVGLAVAVEVDTGVGVAGGPGQIEMAFKNGPAGPGVKQATIGMPPGCVGYGGAR
jgi:hypothetical protein